jgi:hypothetical protein
MRTTLVLFLTAAALALPASALAAPVIAAPVPVASTAQATTTTTQGSVVDTQSQLQPLSLASGKTALNAYANYLQALVKTAPIAQQETVEYVATETSPTGCKSGLAPLTDPSYEVNSNVQATLSLLGQEIGNDLSITFDSTALTPFAKLSTTLSRLHWVNGSGAALVIKHFLIAQETVLSLTPSNLCQDVLLVAVAPHKLPWTAKAFLKEYTKDSNVADMALAAFLNLLHSYETPSEHAVVNRIANLATQVNRLSQATIMANATALTADLKST